MPIPDDEIAQHLPLVTHVVSGLKHWPLEYEEAIAWGTYGLVQAAKRFDPDRGVKFASYAAHRIKGEVLDRRRSMYGGRYLNVPPPHSLDHLLSDMEFQVPDLEARNHESILEREDLAVDLVRVLELREKKIIYLYYIVHKPFWEIGKILGISESRVVQIHKKALARMRMAA